MRPFQVDGREFIYNDPVNEYTNKPLATLDVSEDGAGTELEYVFLDFGAPESSAALTSPAKWSSAPGAAACPSMSRAKTP